MKKIIFHTALFGLLGCSNVLLAQNQATLVLNNGSEMYGTINIEPGKPFKCEITIKQKSTVREKSKGRFNKQTTSYEAKFPAYLIKYVIMNFTEYYPKSVYDQVTKQSTCYLTQRVYGKSMTALYLFKDNTGVSSYFFEDAMVGGRHNIDDSLFTGGNSSKELSKLFLKCKELSSKFTNKEADYTLTASSTLEQKINAFKKWIDEYNNCLKQ